MAVEQWAAAHLVETLQPQALTLKLQGTVQVLAPEQARCWAQWLKLLWVLVLALM